MLSTKILYIIYQEINLNAVVGYQWQSLLSSGFNLVKRKQLREENLLSFREKLRQRCALRYQALKATTIGQASLQQASQYLEQILEQNGIQIDLFFRLLQTVMETRPAFQKYMKRFSLGFYGPSNTAKTLFISLISRVMTPAILNTTSSEFCLEQMADANNLVNITQI